ncbi:MAG: hypothetical protein P4N59_07880 [Negativicutes bacterium]|nr:hypothetical protein [Negativicutes bacterium]
MQEQRQGYLTVWGDTVDIKELLIGLILGALVGYGSYVGGLWYLKIFHPGIAKGVLQGYALLFGIGGCLVVGVIAAKVTKAKRVFVEDDSSIDKQAALLEFNLDLEREAEYLKSVPPDIKKEMHQLQIYDLFADKVQRKEGAQ